MLLVVDIGNSNTVFGVFDQSQLIHQFRMETTAKKTEDEYLLFIKEMLHIHSIDLSNITDAVISCVAPIALSALERFFKKYCKITPLIANQFNHGVTVNGAPAHHIGSDLAVNAIAVSNIMTNSCLIIDCGTATTFALLEPNILNYKGIAIAPGANAMIQALHHNTAQLPLLNFAWVDSVFGCTTKNAMLAGSYFGFIGLVKEMISRVRLEYKKDFSIIATGGSYLIKDEIKDIDIIEPNLTLLGLKFFHEKTKRLP